MITHHHKPVLHKSKFQECLCFKELHKAREQLAGDRAIDFYFCLNIRWGEARQIKHNTELRA